jgi:hypothetical protein
MTTSSHRTLRMRVAASVALFLHLFLVGFVPAGEVLHEHGRASGVEWHTDGDHQHSDESGDCPLVVASTSTGLASERVPAVDEPVAELEPTAPAPTAPSAATPRSPVTARGPPAR